MPVSFDKRTKRYRDSFGRFIAERTIRKEISKIVSYTEKQMRFVSKQLAEAKASIPAWQTGMAKLIKNSHSLVSAIAGGGRKQMTPQKWGRAGAQIREQYKYLNNFARAVEQNRLSPKQIEARAASYAASAKAAYFNAEKETKIELGLTLVRRELNAMESCAGCLSWAGRGYVPIGEMPDIGSLECKNHCRCELIYQ